MTIQMKENPGVVETIIDLLNHINVDGETMQYILENVGMEVQMLRQLMMSQPIDEVNYMFIERTILENIINNSSTLN
jgi:hypothetical protein